MFTSIHFFLSVNLPTIINEKVVGFRKSGNPEISVTVGRKK